MNKEIRDYQESMFWGLSFRQCLFSVLAILAALGIYFLTRKYAGEQVTGWLCVLGAAPFAACGFFRYHGMTAEQFAWAVIKSELLYPKISTAGSLSPRTLTPDSLGFLYSFSLPCCFLHGREPAAG